MGLLAKDQVVGRTVFLPGDLGDNLFPCLFQFLDNVWISWLMSPCIYKATKGWSSLSHDVISLIVILLPLSFPFKDPCNYVRPRIISSC